MTTNNGDTYNDISGDPFNTAEEVPCMDAVSPNQLEEVNHLKSYILNRIRRHCAKTLMGPWANPQNIDIVEVGGGLSNYLYKAQLKPEAIDSSCSVPKEVFIRVYGELLRSNMNSVILDAVLFALLSEKRLGPKLFGVFPGGRIEEFVESRTLKREELSIPSVRDCVALHMGGLHSLTLPLPKMPTFLFKTLAKFLQQLTGTRQPPVRRPHSCTPTATEGGGGGGGGEQDAGLPDDVLFSPQPGSLATSQLFGSTSSICSVHETQPHLFKFVNDWRLVEEFEWLRTTFFGNMDRFPVRFCHNDIQENNLLLYKDPSQRGWYRILTIDYEYSSYNFRCIDVGNFFNEWTYDNTYPHAPGFAYYPDAYPSREEQLAFWRKYLTVYQFAECAGRIPGTYIQHSRRVHSQSVCTQSKMEIVKLLRSPPSAPIFNENSEIGDCDACNTTTNYCDEDPALRCLSDLEEVRELEEVTLTPEQEEALTLESTYGALFSHIWWAVWALIQAQISSFEFGFIEYAESRMTAYYNLKKTLPASEFPNHENPSPDIPSLRKTSEQLFTMDPVSRVYKNGENKMSSSSFYIEEGDVD